MTTHTGQIAWKQISVSTKMAVGARQACLTDSGCRFKVLRTSRYVEVTYEPGLDLYSVDFFRIKRGTQERIALGSHSGVYADMLSDIVYSLCHQENN